MVWKAEPDRDRPRLGKLPRLYRFFLNPYTNVRFTTLCPDCCGKTKHRKVPLAIHVHGWGMVILNKTCRLCFHCDLLIAHQDEIDGCLSQTVPHVATRGVDKGYFIVGTVERKDWRRGLTNPLTNAEMIEALHDFEEHVRFKRATPWDYVAHPGAP